MTAINNDEAIVRDLIDSDFVAVDVPICDGCTVQAECLAAEMVTTNVTGDTAGVWAGTSPAERKARRHLCA